MTVQTMADVEPAQAQHAGRRDSQQDACAFGLPADEAGAAHAGYLAVLADGMGGMRNGEWAAHHAVQAFIGAYRDKPADEPVPAALQRALAAANEVVHEEATRLRAVDRMGTTLAVAVVRGLELHWLNVGDSRVYLCEDGHLMGLSTDHSYAEVLRQRVHRGELSAGEALGHPLRHALTSYLGRAPPVQHAASGAAVQLRPGAWVLLCSDGLTQALDDERIAAELHGRPQQACERLLAAALARCLPDQDNITVSVLQVPRAGRAPQAGSASRGRVRVPVPPVSGSPGASASAGSPAAAWRVRWREPMLWAGLAAAAGALLLLWLARPLHDTPPGAAAASAASPARPTVDLLKATDAAASAGLSPHNPTPTPPRGTNR